MELKGKIIKLLPLQTGTSSRGEWRKQEFVVETPGQYPKQVCLYMWGDAIDNNKIEEGMEITASIEIESREYNGRWYTNVKAWRIEPAAQAASVTPPASEMDGPPPGAPFSEPRMADLSSTEDDDLPF
jgi:hypothetical protein